MTELLPSAIAPVPQCPPAQQNVIASRLAATTDDQWDLEGCDGVRGKHQSRWLGSLGLVGGLAIALAPAAVWAQLVPDGSLGVERSVIQKINELSDRIDGGAARGANLFHSFQEFNVGQGRSVYFANPAQIQNILSRVTGGNVSNILGKLGVLGSANLFLINPNGIIFGPNSSLDIQGSFFATTADGIRLGDKGFFSATEPGKSDLLSVSPGALFFNQAASQAGNIINRGNLVVGGDLTLAAGNLDLQGQLLSGRNLTLHALDGVKIRDTVESPFVAAAVGDLLVQGNQSVDIFALNHPQSAIVSYGNLTLKSSNPVIGDAHYWSGGNFRIENLDDNLGELHSIKDPIIRTGGDVFIGAYGGTSLHIIAGGSVTIPGFIVITGADPEFGLQENITLSNGQQINIDGKNNATLDIRAGVDEKFIGTPLIQESGNDFFVGRDLDSVSPTSADINIGAILFTTSLVDDTQNITGDVLLTNQYHPNLSLQGSINVKASLSPIFSEAIQTGSLNNGGRVTIDSRGNININGDINSTSLEKGGEIVLNSIGDIFITDSDINVRSSKDGNINVNASNANILNSSIRSGINTDLGESDGQAGNIILDIKNNLTIDDSTISNFVRTNSQGNAGAIIIKTNSLDLKNGGNINASTLGTGDAGLISITAVENINLASDSYIASRVELTGIGNSGVININASNLTIEGQIESSVLGEGQLSAISLNVVESLTMNGGKIFNLVRGISPITEENTNLAGINITTASLYLNNGSNINTSVTGQGNGGGVHITASDSISLSASGIYNVLAEEARGSTSNIEINTASFKIQNRSIINSTTLGSGDAGKINIDVLKDMIVENSNIVSSSQSQVQGNSGGIDIKAGTLNINDQGSLIALVSGMGKAGEIKINISDTFTLEGFLSGIYSVVLGNGSSGGIDIKAGTLNILDGAGLDADVSGIGDSGTISIDVKDSMTLQGSDIFSKVLAEAQGKSGGIDIKAGTLNILDGSVLDANVSGIGDSGTISIDVKDSMTLRGSDISSAVLAEAQGKSGGIDIKTGTLNILDSSVLDANVSGIGDSGTISIDVKDSMTLRGSDISSTVLFEATGKSNSGEIEIKADNLNMIDSSIYANILGNGNSGIIDINVSNTFNLQKSYISNTVLGEGKGGGIKVNSDTLMILNGSYLESSTFGASNAGQIIIDVSGNMTLQGEDSQGTRSRINNVIYGGATGKAEGIDIKAGTLNILDGARILSNVIGTGDAGKITIGVSDTITLKGTDSQGRVSNISSLVQEEAEGNSGKIEIKANTLNLLDGAELNNSTDGIGDAGGVTIDVTDTITLRGENRRGLGSAVISRVNFDGLGNSGEIEIKARNLDLLDGARIDSSSRGIGNAGKIIFNIGDTMTLKGESSIGFGSIVFSNVFGEGNSGGIVVNAGTLLLDKGQISNSIFGTGNAGKIIIDVDRTMTLQGESIFGNSAIFSRVEAGAKGDSSGIEVKAGTLNLFDGASINAGTDGIGNAGKVIIYVTDAMTLRGRNSLGEVSGVGSQVGLGAEGNSGGVEIKAGNLQMFDGTTINTSTQGIGNAGKITINVDDKMTLGESEDVRTSVASRVLLGANGDSKGIEVNAGTLELLGGGRLEATTEGLGKAGKVIVNVSGDLILKGKSSEGDGSSIVSAVSPDGKNNSQGIEIKANNVILQDSAFISTVTGSNGNAGDIIITAKETFSASGARVLGDFVLGGVSAYTLSTGQAGNIIINSPVFNLSNSAEISAFTRGTGNAGSIIINSPQIVDIGQGSKIIAETSDAGKAGDITITTDTLNIGKDAQLSATAKATATNPQGGGSITLNTSNLNISGKLGIFAETQGQSPAGNLTLQPSNNNPNLNIRFTDNGFISASTTATGNGGNIAISAPQTVDIRGQGTIAVETSGSGNAGTIGITTQNLTLADGLEISASTTGQGNAGNINLNAANLSLSQTKINAFTDSTGNAGSISISNQGNNANQVSLSDNSTISTEIKANGQAQQPSNIDIRTNNLTLDNSRITASTAGKGDAGNITVPGAQEITLNNSKITVSTSGIGHTGQINLNANQKLELSNSQINSAVELGAVGNSQGIILNTPSLSLNNSQINAFTDSTGNAGSISISNQENNASQVSLNNNSTISTEIKANGQANDQANHPSNIDIRTNNLTLDNSTITAATKGKGNAGDIAVPNANQIILLNQSEINTSTSREGNTGKIDLNADQKLELNNSQISSAVKQGAIGNSQQITLNTPNLTLNNSQINAFTNGIGNAGSISISNQGNNANQVSLNNKSRISTEIKANGQANDQTNHPSNIDIRTENLTLNNSTISAATKGKGAAGNIAVPNANQIILLNKSVINASTSREGNTGKIDLNANQKLELNHSQIKSAVEQGAVGDSLQITLNTPNLDLNSSKISAETAGKGNAGSIFVVDANILTLDSNSTITTAIAPTGIATQPSNITLNTQQLTLDNNSRITTAIQADKNSKGQGIAGNITVPNAQVITLKNSNITVSTSGIGNTGKIDLNANQRLQLINNSQINSSVEQGAIGDAQQIILNTPNLDLNISIISAATSGKGNAGIINVPNATTITLDNSTISTAIAPTGVATQPSNITLNTQQLTLNNNSQITASTSGKGDTGVIDLKAAGNLNLTNSQINSSVEQGAVGNSRQITLDTPNLNLNNSQINATTAGQGNAGSIIVPNANTITLDNSTISTAIAPTGVATQPSNITLNIQQLTLNNNSQITASTQGNGDAGSISISNQENNASQVSLNNNSTISTEIKANGQANDQANHPSNIDIRTDNLKLNNSTITAATRGKGNAGDISVPNANQIILNQSEINTSTSGEGNTGKIDLNANQRLQLINNSQINSSVEQGAIGDAQQIILNTPNLDLNTSIISAATSGKGNAGIINVPNATTITLDNSTISTAIAPTGVATQPSNITLNTQQLTLNNNSRITASTEGKGNAGNITVPNAQTLSLDNNSQISASTSGEGNAGDIALNAQTITLNNSSAITTTVNPNAIGRGGNITLQTTGNSLTLNNQSQISSRSQGQGNAGNILINSAGNVTLTNSDISTSAEQASGGAITITARNLRLNGDSNLRTNVASGAGGGGDITLTADSILAFGDSDILAFARDGKGGNITFNTPIFFAEGFQPVPQESDPNSLNGNNRVDINASGAVSGIIILPDLSFIQNSLSDLPENLIDTDNLIANSCVVPNRQKAGTFIITGSGGLPTRPGDASLSSYSTGTVRTVPDESASSRSWQPGKPIIEPQGVYRLPNGRLVLSRECP